MYAARRNGSGGMTTNGSTTRKMTAKSASNFHPKMIASQIVAIQCFHYFLLAVFFQINNALYGKSITIDRIFTDKYVKLWHPSGWPDLFAILLASVAGALMLAIIVEKSKKCLDFSVTLFLLHLVICTVYDGFPYHMEWWVIHIAATIIMTLLGEYLCSRKELDDIPLLQV